MNATAAATPSCTAQATCACAVIGKYRRMSWKSARSVRGDGKVRGDAGEGPRGGLREVGGVGGEPLHRLLALLEHRPPIFEVQLRGHIRIDQVFNRPVYGSRVLIHAGLKLGGVLL